MKKNHSSHFILDFSISDDLITYPANYSSIPSNNVPHNIGILIAELADWNNSIYFLNTLYRYSLIDSFSIQFEIGDPSRIFILMKITGIGTSELKYRYYNLKKHIEKNDLEINILQSSKLEKSYISILGILDLSFLHSSQLFREKHNEFYIQSREHKKIYYFLGFVDFVWLSQQNHIQLLTEILHASNLRCSLIFYNKNLGNYSENCYYLVGTTNNLTRFIDQLADILTQCCYPFPINNLFHPYFLGRILIRGPLNPKYLHKTKSPTILSSRFNNNEQKVLQTTSHTSYSHNHIDLILQNTFSEQKSRELYSLFNGKVILFRIQKLDLSTIRIISDQITNSFHYCILFFEKSEDYTNFIEKIQGLDMKKTLIVSDYQKLKKIIEKFEKKYSSQKLSIP